ncbi:phage integrase [Pseudomonas fluorescens]|uniref:Phage integrase n=1 Tax=Pseudomonas fluorescens TaxID=294 RepID=A0A379IBD5_PSEFL|nr:phage integrase [Pseudomonas fluorescens]
MKDELLTRNPAVEEAGRVTGHLYQALTSSIRMYAAYFKFAFYTGMRPGEVAALRAKQSRRQHKQSPYVFPPTRNVEYIQQANMTDKHFQAALVELKIRSRRQYNCRHTYATMCLMAGMNLGFIANQLGHSVQMLLST